MLLLVGRHLSGLLLKQMSHRALFLGRCCFLYIYIYDIVRNIGASVRLIADDTSLYIVVDSPLSSAAILNFDEHNSQLG